VREATITAKQAFALAWCKNPCHPQERLSRQRLGDVTKDLNPRVLPPVTVPQDPTCKTGMWGTRTPALFTPHFPECDITPFPVPGEIRVTPNVVFRGGRFLEQNLLVRLRGKLKTYTAEFRIDEHIFPFVIEGKLRNISLELVEAANYDGASVSAVVQGKTYKFQSLEEDGTFILRKGW
jgi:hypothetical protein